MKIAGISDGMGFLFQRRRAMVTTGKCKVREFLANSIGLMGAFSKVYI